jgi:hypothetical protein
MSEVPVHRVGRARARMTTLHVTGRDRFPGLTVGITERAAHRIVNELVAAGYLSKHRVGRRNSYQVHLEVPLRHPLEQDHAVGELLELLLGGKRPARRSPRPLSG